MSPRQVVWTRPSLRELRRLDRQVAVRVEEAVERFAQTGHGDIRAVQGTDDQFALRVGDWRIWFEHDDDADAVVVLKVRHRSDAYRGWLPSAGLGGWIVMLVEMVVESVRVNLQTYQRVVVLKEKGADRYLPIWIGNNEADAIVIQLQNVPVPRPQTHDLLKSVISQLGGRVTRIVVNDLSDDVFYARVNIDIDGKHVEIDSRPSDAIALAVRVQAPIYAEDAVLEKAGVALDSESAEHREGEEKSPAQREEEEKKLSPFRDFINTLDLDDLGKPER